MGSFVPKSPALLDAAVELWLAVWPAVEGDEEMVLMLEKMVQACRKSFFFGFCYYYYYDYYLMCLLFLLGFGFVFLSLFS